MVKRTLAAVSLLLAVTAGCGDADDGGPAGGRTMTVFAAASLTDVFTKIGKAFEATHPGVRVRLNFAASSTLSQQITQGAPVDVFAAASSATMQTVLDAGDAADQPQLFVRNFLVIAVPKDNPGKVEKIGDLSGSGLKVVLCAEQVPCGAAADKALDAAGVEVEPVSRERDVRAVLTKVGLGEADAGLVYRTDARAAERRVTGIEFPESADAINDYPIVEVAGAPQSALAKEFIQLVFSDQARKVLDEAGFEAP